MTSIRLANEKECFDPECKGLQIQIRWMHFATFPNIPCHIEMFWQCLLKRSWRKSGLIATLIDATRSSSMRRWHAVICEKLKQICKKILVDLLNNSKEKKFYSVPHSVTAWQNAGGTKKSLQTRREERNRPDEGTKAISISNSVLHYVSGFSQVHGVTTLLPCHEENTPLYGTLRFLA